MPHVPDDFVMGRAEDFVQRQSQLDNAKVGCQMAAVLADHLHDQLADLLSKVFELHMGQIVQVLWAVNRIEDLNRRHSY